MALESTFVVTESDLAEAPEGAPPLPDEPVPQIPGHQIERELGRGGMGVVYLAQQTQLGRTVAIKMILAGHAQGEELRRFMNEAEAVARFQHPNIVQIYEVGEVDGRPFFSLEYVDGGNLENACAGGPLPWRRSCELLVVIARAIHAAHEEGIVHRDLKPANILLTASGTPKITDFGIAKRLDAVNQTQTGKILGTPAYMSPEQALGRIDLIGPSSDVYALGAILYDLVSGHPPFQAANTLDTLLQVLTREPVRLSTLQPTVPRDLEIVCHKCLEKKPHQRYASATALADDLECVLRGEPIQARPIGTGERLRRWLRHHPVWATLAAMGGLGLVALLVVGAWFTSRLQRELAATEAARHEAAQARSELQLRLVRRSAEGIDSDLRQLASAPRLVASALGRRADWTSERLENWLRSGLEAQPNVFGIAVAFEPGQFRDGVEDYCLYAYRNGASVQTKQLLPPSYTPNYREWDWYRGAKAGGSYSEPYLDEGGGNIPMVTFSVPFERDGKKAGVVTADLSLDYFRALESSMRDSGIDGSSHMLVVTRGGIIVSHPKPAFRFPQAAAATPKSASAPIWQRVLGGELGRGRGTDPATGRPAELLFAPVAASGWSCVAILPDR